MLDMPLEKIASTHKKCYEMLMWYLRFLPKNSLSRFVGELANLEEPKPLVSAAKNWFAKKYQLNMQEAELPLAEYASISKLFTRKLKPGLRPIGLGLVNPCDARLTCAEHIESDQIIQAKGQSYKLSEFLRVNPDDILAKFSGGLALTYYLCPTDYHRVHSPVDGELEMIEHVPGALWAVNDWSTQNIDRLFAVNERVIFWLRTALGPVALVMVGATNVGKISVSVGPESFQSTFTTNAKGVSEPRQQAFMPAVTVKKGQEIGVFNMGSTVIMVYPAKCLNVIPKLGPVKMGATV